MENQKKLRVKLSTFQTPLSFNDWVNKYNVSRDYVEPTKYYQHNASSGYTQAEEQKPTFVEIVRRNLLLIFN